MKQLALFEIDPFRLFELLQLRQEIIFWISIVEKNSCHLVITSKKNQLLQKSVHNQTSLRPTICILLNFAY